MSDETHETPMTTATLPSITIKPPTPIENQVCIYDLGAGWWIINLNIDSVGFIVKPGGEMYWPKSQAFGPEGAHLFDVPSTSHDVTEAQEWLENFVIHYDHEISELLMAESPLRRNVNNLLIDYTGTTYILDEDEFEFESDYYEAQDYLFEVQCQIVEQQLRVTPRRFVRARFRCSLEITDEPSRVEDGR